MTKKSILEEWAKKKDKMTEDFLNKKLKGIEDSFKDFNKGYRFITLKDSEILDNASFNENLLSDFTNRVIEKYDCSCVSIATTSSTFSSNEYVLMFKK